MSEWKKVWTNGDGCTVTCRGGQFNRPALLTEIDESLPYPGDGRVWVTPGGHRGMILTPPVEGKVLTKWDGGGVGSYRAANLVERKPPEHKPWCARHPSRYPPYVTQELIEDDCVTPCTCELREGERRKGGAMYILTPSGTLYRRSVGGWWFDERVEDRRAGR